MSSIINLPTDLIEYILFYLTDYAIYAFTTTCKSFKLRNTLYKMQQYRKYLYNYAREITPLLKQIHIKSIRTSGIPDAETIQLCKNYKNASNEHIATSIHGFDNSLIIPTPIVSSLKPCEKEVIEFKITTNDIHEFPYQVDQHKDVYKIEFNGIHDENFQFRICYNYNVLLELRKLNIYLTHRFDFIIVGLYPFGLRMYFHVVGFKGTISVYRTKHLNDSYYNIYYERMHKRPEMTFIPVIIYHDSYIRNNASAVIIETAEPITSVQVNIKPHVLDNLFTVDIHMINYMWQRVSKKVRPANCAVIMLTDTWFKTRDIHITYNDGLSIEKCIFICRNFLLTTDSNIVLRYASSF